MTDEIVAPRRQRLLRVETSEDEDEDEDNANRGGPAGAGAGGANSSDGLLSPASSMSTTDSLPHEPPKMNLHMHNGSVFPDGKTKTRRRGACGCFSFRLFVCVHVGALLTYHHRVLCLAHQGRYVCRLRVPRHIRGRGVSANMSTSSTTRHPLMPTTKSMCNTLTYARMLKRCRTPGNRTARTG